MNGDDFAEETCAKYHPTTQGSSMHTGNGVKVTLQHLSNVQNVTKRVLRLTSDALGRPWQVTQFQLQEWKMYDEVSRHALIPFMSIPQGAGVIGDPKYTLHYITLKLFRVA